MKSKNLFSAFVVILAAAVLTSCSSSIEIVKRQFNDGYYVNISKKKPASKSPEQAVVTPDENKASQVTQTPAVTKEELVQNEESTVKPNESSITTPAPAENTTDERGDFETTTDAEGISYESGTQEAENNTPSFSYPTSLFGGSVPTFIMILLCLFLPFIAVGIVDDWGTRFLIDILLCLLFYIPGIIYAFIVCFS